MLSWAECPDTTPILSIYFETLQRQIQNMIRLMCWPTHVSVGNGKWKVPGPSNQYLTSKYSNRPLCAKGRIPRHLAFHCVLPKDENLALRPIRTEEHGATPYPKMRTRLRYYSVPRPKAGNAAALWSVGSYVSNRVIFLRVLC